MPARQAFALVGLLVDRCAAAAAALDGCGLLALDGWCAHGCSNKESPLKRAGVLGGGSRRLVAITRKADPYLHVRDRDDSPGLGPEPLMRYALGCWDACRFHGSKARLHVLQVDRLVAVPVDGMADFILCPHRLEPNVGTGAVDDVPVLPACLEAPDAVAVLENAVSAWARYA